MKYNSTISSRAGVGKEKVDETAHRKFLTGEELSIFFFTVTYS